MINLQISCFEDLVIVVSNDLLNLFEQSIVEAEVHIVINAFVSMVFVVVCMSEMEVINEII